MGGNGVSVLDPSALGPPSALIPSALDKFFQPHPVYFVPSTKYNNGRREQDFLDNPETVLIRPFEEGS